MSETNPYQSPQADSLVQGVTLFKGLGLVLLSTVVFGVGGGLLGLTIALVLPNYYHTVFTLESTTSVVQLGVGLGITQGVAAGIVVGVALVAVVAWYRSRVSRLLQNL